MRRVIITDLTRFSTVDNVCTAAIDVATGECFRPMPYLKSETCAKLNILPGAILTGDITLRADARNPHIEDSSYANLKFHGACSAEEFKSVLDNSLSPSVSVGFGIDLDVGQKHIPIEETANCSIITIKVPPNQIQIHEDQYKPGKVKLSFTDGIGANFRYLSITDLGFYDYAKRHQNDGSLEDLQQYISSQDEVYLRIGVGRVWKIGDRNGYWLQANGIYTFPEFHQEIRSYS